MAFKGQKETSPCECGRSVLTGSDDHSVILGIGGAELSVTKKRGIVRPFQWTSMRIPGVICAIEVD
jgi:hypothetical protein